MSVAAYVEDGREVVATSASEAGPAPRRIIASYGFWVFLLSDIVMFSALFATYAVLATATAGGPMGSLLFNQRTVAMETALLLFSSYTCGLMSLAASSRHRFGVLMGAAATFILGAAFLTLELREFRGMIAMGATPERSAFLSAFFTLVGCHGLHVTLGLAWLLLTMVQLGMWGFRPMVERRMLCFGLFWHALDIIWVMIFTVVYLMGVVHG
jgi:cytochrome o ubiquinol oxidase subunit 3